MALRNRSPLDRIFAVFNIPASGTYYQKDDNTNAAAQAMVVVDATTGAEKGTAAAPIVVSGGTGSSANQVQGTGAAGAAAVGNPVGVGGVYNSTVPTLTNGQRGDVQLTTGSSVRSALAVIRSSGADAQSNTGIGYCWDDTSNATGNRAILAAAGYVFNGASWDRLKKPSAVSRIASSANSTNATVVKASAGDVFSVTAYNSNAAARYLKLYNKATAPTVGTDTPVMTIPMPPMAAVNINLQSMYFATGIGLALTTGAADSDTGAVGAGDILGLNVSYQ